MQKPHAQIRVPPSYPASLIYLDESGTAGNDPVFVIGAVKVRGHGAFASAIRTIRERYGYYDEFRFNRVSRAKLPMYTELLERLAGLSVNFAACIVDTRQYDPYKQWPQRWDAHIHVAGQLLRGCINRQELTCVLMDMVSAPAGVSVEEEVRRDVNRRLRAMAIVTAACLDSKTSDGLQVADLFAGAVAFDHRRRAGDVGRQNSHKAKLTEKFQELLNVEQLLGRTPRLNVAVFTGPKAARPRPSRSARPTGRN